MDIERYDSERDREAGRRIWREVGWLPTDDKKWNEVADLYVNAGRALVAKIDGEAECLVTSHPGTITMLDTALSFQAVTSVTAVTSGLGPSASQAGRRGGTSGTPFSPALQV